MASSNEIPNLRTLLGARRGGGLRGRGRGRGGLGESSEGDDRELRENAVKCTDQDAAGSRVSCVELGYLHDPYAKLLATQPLTRRLPLLNRGTKICEHIAIVDIDFFRNICPHFGYRPTGNHLSSKPTWFGETDCISWCWH